VQLTSTGSTVTISTPPTGSTTAGALPPATGAFSGKNFSLQLVVSGDTLLMTAVAPTASAIPSLNGNFVTSKPGATPVSGTFTLTKSAPVPQAHAKQVKQYGDSSPGSDGGSTDIIEAIGKWVDSLFNW
jgi:hypothetical protein